MNEIQAQGKAELAELQADRERLEAICPKLHLVPLPDEYIDIKVGGQNYRIMHTHYKSVTGWFLFKLNKHMKWRGSEWGRYSTFRDAIDAAMKAQEVEGQDIGEQ